MSTSRRRFLKAAGLTVVGVGGAAPLIAARASGSTAEAVRKDRWAMIIDTKACAQDDGCTACVDACHTTHNVPDIGNPKEEVKWIWKEKVGDALHERLNEHTPTELRERKTLVLCNHCDNPPCVRVRPTQATWKRADGLVMMDMHRCVGCRYCILGCPYGARSFNFQRPRKYLPDPLPNPKYPTRMRGVVEKCTLCAERLAANKIPACVEACANAGTGAIQFGSLADDEFYEKLRSSYTVRRKEMLGTRPQVYYKL